jgi:hypothetical protein
LDIKSLKSRKPEKMLSFDFKCTKLSMLAENEVAGFILSVMLIPTCQSAVQKQCQRY